MRFIFLIIVTVLLPSTLQSQNNSNVGIMVMIEDSITHQYIGKSADKNFIQKYPATLDFMAFAIDTALIVLEQNFGKWDFCTIDFDNFLIYEQNREELRAPDFRSFRQDWFNELIEKYEVDAVLVIRNSTNFTDGIHWSNANLMGYGIYNGQTRLLNNAYIQLEFLLFSSGRPLTLIPGPIYKRDPSYPRIDKEGQQFSEADLLIIEKPLKELIVNQIEAAVRNNNFMRGLR